MPDYILGTNTESVRRVYAEKIGPPRGGQRGRMHVLAYRHRHAEHIEKRARQQL